MAENNAEKTNQEIRLDRKSKALFLILGIFIIGSVAATYWRYMVKKDYVIQAQIDCDPETENCLVWRCDPASTEEGEVCTGDTETDIWYYKILNRNAKNIPDCDPAEEACTAYQCEPGEEACEITNCDSENAPEGEECSAPEQYLKENPPEEESQCGEGDEECVLEQEYDAEDAECLTSEEECAPGDENCSSAQEEQSAADSSVDTPGNDTNF